MTGALINDGGIQREMTDSEHQEWLEHVADVKALANANKAAAAAKVSAREKLKALGLTDEEIGALVG